MKPCAHPLVAQCRVLTPRYRKTEQPLPSSQSTPPAGTYHIYPSFPLRGMFLDLIVDCESQIRYYKGLENCRRDSSNLQMAVPFWLKDMWVWSGTNLWQNLRRLSEIMSIPSLSLIREWQWRILSSLSYFPLYSFFLPIEFSNCSEIDELISPFLGGDDPIFGFRYPGSFADFFDADKTPLLQRDISSVNVIPEYLLLSLRIVAFDHLWIRELTYCAQVYSR